MCIYNQSVKSTVYFQLRLCLHYVLQYMLPHLKKKKKSVRNVTQLIIM